LLLAVVLQALSIMVVTSDSSSSTSVSICKDKTIQVQSISSYCDSPYTFYYGNGAHRKSDVCDYGDKVTITVNFYVSSEVQSTIYMQLSAYDDADEQLFLGRSIDLCDYVGKSCNTVGYYSFSKQVQFAYIDGDELQFVPSWEVAFSDSADGGYDLGGANIQCDKDESSYFDWQNIRTNTTLLHVRTENFAQEYGILLVTCISLAVLGIALLNQTRNHVEYRRVGNNRMQLLDADNRLS
jgi:hypothetical protein